MDWIHVGAGNPDAKRSTVLTNWVVLELSGARHMRGTNATFKQAPKAATVTAGQPGQFSLPECDEGE